VDEPLFKEKIGNLQGKP